MSQAGSAGRDRESRKFAPPPLEGPYDNPRLTMATAFAYVGGSVMGYVVYANWVGIG